MEQVATTETQSLSAPKRTLKRVLWGLLFVVLLALFVAVKFPPERIHTAVMAKLAPQLATQGIALEARTGALRLGFGLRYEMESVVLNFMQTGAAVSLDKLSATPRLSSLLIARLGADVTATSGEGEIDLTLVKSGEKIQLDFDANQFDLGRAGILSFAGSITGNGLISGSGALSIDPNDLSKLSGEIDLNLKKAVLNSGSVFGLTIPEALLGEIKVKAKAENGKVNLHTQSLGKKGGTDDLIGRLEGEITLSRQLMSSQAKLKTQLEFSEKLKRGLPILALVLEQGKQSDGSYSYQLSGPFNSLTPTPVAP